MAFMLPFLGKAALAFGPSLLNHLFGGDPNQQYRQNVQNLLAPQNMGRLSQQYYQQGLGSPAFGLAQRQIAAGSNAASNAFQSRAAQSGVGNSGLGNLAASVGPSMAGGQLANLQAALWQSAQGQAQNNIQGQIGALTGQMPVSQTQQLGAAGISSLGPLLQQLMEHLSRGGGFNGQMNPMMPNAPGVGGGGGALGNWLQN